MKKFLLYFTAVAFAACNNAENKTASTEKAPANTDLIQLNLKGKVKTLDESAMVIDSTGASKKDSSSNWNEFDSAGYITVYEVKDINGTTKEKQSFTRFDNGQMKQIVVNNSDGKQKEKWDLTIDSNGKYSSATVYDSNGKISGVWKEISENDHGQPTKGTQYTENGKLKSSFENNYDGANFTGGWNKDSTGKETGKTSLKLNDKGDPIEMSSTTITKDSSKTEVTTYKYDSYDDQGNWTKRTESKKDKPVKVVTRTFAYYKAE